MSDQVEPEQPGIDERGVEDVAQGDGPGLFDVTVRVPVGFATPEEMAGWLSVVVSSSMAQRRWVGAPMLIWRTTDGHFAAFHDGMIDPYDGVPPHGDGE